MITELLESMREVSCYIRPDEAEAKKKCRVCPRWEYLTDDGVCPGCALEMRECPVCFRLNADDMAACDGCGAKMPVSDPDPREQEYARADRDYDDFKDRL